MKGFVKRVLSIFLLCSTFVYFYVTLFSISALAAPVHDRAHKSIWKPLSSDSTGDFEFNSDFQIAVYNLSKSVYFGEDERQYGDWDWHESDSTMQDLLADDIAQNRNHSGLDLYAENLSRLYHAKTNGDMYYLNIAKTFGVTLMNEESDKQCVSRIIGSWAGGSNFFPVYQYADGYGNDYHNYVACDYCKDDGMYYYYFISAHCRPLEADSFLSFVGRSSKLIVRFYNTASRESITSQIRESISGLLDCITVADSVDIIKYSVENMDTSTYSKRLKQACDILEFDEQHHVSIVAGNNLSIAWMDDYNSLASFRIAEIDRSLALAKMYTTTVDLGNPDYLNFGNSSCIIPDSEWLEDNSIEAGTDDYIVNIIASIVSSVASSEGSNTANAMDSYIGLFSSDDYAFIRDVLTTFKTELQDCIEDQALKDKFSEADGDAFSELSYTSDAFSICNAALKYNIGCIVSGKTFNGDYKLGSAVFVLDRSFSKIESDTGKLYTIGYYWDKLSDYQRAVLQSAYVEKWSILEKNIPNLRTSSKIIFPSSSIGEYSPKDLIKPQEIDTIGEEMSSYDISLTGNVLNVARSSGILSKYVVASAVYNNSSESIESVYALYNSDLESLISDMWSYGDTDNSWFSYFPRHIGRFDDTGSLSDGYVSMLETEENWSRFVQLLYNVNYAFEVCAWSEEGSENGYTPEQIKGWFSGSEEAPDILSWMQGTARLSNYDVAMLKAEAPSWGTASLDMLRSIIELEEMCDWLDIGLNDWSDTIRAYREVYKANEVFFNNLKEAGVLYRKSDSGQSTVKEPLGKFFSLSGKKMTDQWIKGFSLSALYVPMETNVYDASSVLYLKDPEWVSDFFYKYAFFRKALYINTDNSAIVNQFSSGNRSGTRVATLSDLLNYDRDIILTVDDNFYNANKVDTVISRLDYTAIRNTDDAADTSTGLQSVGNAISGMMDLNASKVLKTGADMYYSETLKKNVTQLGQSEDDADVIKRVYNQYVLSNSEIVSEAGTESVLDSYEYSVKMSYGVVSAIYKSDSLYNECLKAIVSDNAVFKSSKDICNTPGTNSSHWRSLYNYYMLANLEEQMKNDCASTLDLDAPIFIDIFGNILTESGLVIIPAACNATLCGTYWTPYTVGWSEYYNNGNHITTKDFNEDVYEWLIGKEFSAVTSGPQNWTDVKEPVKENAGGYFWITGGEAVLMTSELTSGNLTGTVQWEALNKNSTVVQNLFFNDAYFSKGQKIYGHTLTNMIIEVLRGAPIEYIDYEYEGLSGNLSISKYGVYMAYKLEELVNVLVSGTNGNALGGNSVVTMPNLAFVSGIEYIMLYVFKIVFAVMVVALGISLYLDATKNSLGVKSVLRFLVTCIMTIVAFTLVPNLVSWTYYSANKNLLAEESGRLMMLNYVKEYDGSEIGITSVTTPETSTELYLKVNNVGVSWWTIIPEVLFGETSSTVTELYEEELKDDAMAMTPGVQMKGDGLYVDVQDIYDSSDIQFTPATNTLDHFVRSGVSASFVLHTQVNGTDKDGLPTVTPIEQQITIGSDNTSVVSFVSPYYVFLEQLVSNVNEYNVSRDITAYSWSFGSNGHVLTYDVVSPYLTSPEFLEEGYDILGLDHLLHLTSQRTLYNYAFTSEDERRASMSSWYFNKGILGENATMDKIDHVYEYARNFVINNSDVLGKVPDEVFLKVMAMQCAIEYNKEFGCSNANGIEIINVDTRDLMRFMVAPSSDMYKYYSYSFARYVYEKSGTIGVVFAALLLVVYWITSFIKPLLMVLILGLLIVNVVFRKLLFRKESRCIEGYLIGCACLCLCNYAYALMLKISMSIADAGFGAVTALVIAFLVQVVYVIGLVGIMAIEVKDWKNNGFGEWQSIGAAISSQIVHAKNIVADRVMSKSNPAYRDSADSRRYASEDYDSESVEAMIERDRERDERGAYSPN